MKKNEVVLYKCIYCGVERKYSIAKLIAHLDINHEGITETDKSELIRDLKLVISSKHKNEKKELIREKTKEQNKLKAEIKEQKLSEFKNNVLNALTDSGIDERKLEIIKSRKTIYKIKRVLMFGLKKEFQVYLDNYGVDYTVEPKNKNGKRRRKKIGKEYFDKTENSIKAIYTPIGNKR
ncbi:hypothetical protein HX038_10205 [Myroides odoratimimus]|uniref:hypothetical protein n=1 Tax=Myroides odoratimimus TaxID=76832 RepID=UPI0025777C5A|nr:hypothetical protein [Myroides odoratimimus]MDM1411128.1 hypothetical protein [Myroides odoratimimus]MEC4007183.1 hypothetical protein [Myroides odoratimimus]MEC4086297.1 hypothetical protein [Myroides odoratimimus]